MESASNAGRNAWIVLSIGVAVFELLAPEGQLMSESVDRALEEHPVITTVAIGAVALHLLNVLPPRIDPLHQVTNLARRINK
jgi:hypothetical protein